MKGKTFFPFHKVLIVSIFKIITYEESLKIHELLEEIKWKMITNKNIGDESMLTDDILVRYEVIIKTINNERKLENGKR